MAATQVRCRVIIAKDGHGIEYRMPAEEVMDFVKKWLQEVLKENSVGEICKIEILADGAQVTITGSLQCPFCGNRPYLDANGDAECETTGCAIASVPVPLELWNRRVMWPTSELSLPQITGGRKQQWILCAC